MINFPCSTFTWKSNPFEPDPHYRYSGGFVGKPGQVYHVRFNLEASCEVRDVASGHVTDWSGSISKSHRSRSSARPWFTMAQAPRTMMPPAR